jgi:DNA-binding transcriptional regulator GbsR (MarR family)
MGQGVSEIPDTKALADELSKIHAENRQLREKITLQAKQLDQQKAPTHAAAKEYAELIDVMTSIMIDVSDIKPAFRNKDEVPDKVSLLDLAVSFKDMLMSGITNEIGMSTLANFAFFTLCPKLQTYDLVKNEKVPGVRYRRYAITKKGTQVLAFIEKSLHRKKNAEPASPKAKI